MITCNKCGCALDEGVNFCNQCGAHVKIQEAQDVINVTATPVEEPKPAAETPVNSAPESGEQNPQQSSNPYEGAENTKQQNAAYYTAPQNDMPPTSGDKAYQQKCLNSLNLHLKHERLCWRISSFVFLAFTAMFVGIGMLMILAGIVSGEFAPAVMGIWYIIVSTVYIPITVVGFIMVKKVDGYRSKLYTDAGPAIERSSSVGMIVFGAIFNTIAMVFIILAFVLVKSNRETFDEIKRNQDAYNQKFGPRA
ncbi:MAG: hypothetical protein ACI4GZ_01445 [Ruminococcus sp.]